MMLESSPTTIYIDYELQTQATLGKNQVAGSAVFRRKPQPTPTKTSDLDLTSNLTTGINFLNF
jgi:hypothetical protein